MRFIGNDESAVSKEKEKFEIVSEAVAANGLKAILKLVGSSRSKKCHRPNCPLRLK